MFFGDRDRALYHAAQVRAALDPMIMRLLADVSEGIRVLQSRDGIVLSEKQILERARNIVMGLVGNYRIESLDGNGDGEGDDDGPARDPLLSDSSPVMGSG